MGEAKRVWLLSLLLACDVLVECLHEPVFEGRALERGAVGVDKVLWYLSWPLEFADQVD